MSLLVRQLPQGDEVLIQWKMALTIRANHLMEKYCLVMPSSLLFALQRHAELTSQHPFMLTTNKYVFHHKAMQTHSLKRRHKFTELKSIENMHKPHLVQELSGLKAAGGWENSRGMHSCSFLDMVIVHMVKSHFHASCISCDRLQNLWGSATDLFPVFTMPENVSSLMQTYKFCHMGWGHKTWAKKDRDLIPVEYE